MTIKSAIANNEIFLQGKYLSIGINEDGTLGTKWAAPTGISTDLATGLKRAGLFADLDGFGAGAASALNDVLLQGRAIEGFNIGYKVGGTKFVQTNQTLTGYSEVDGTNRNASTANQGQAVWSGSTTEKLGVSQKITLADDAKYIRVDVTLTNNSSATMADLRYMRSFDADQSDLYATTNRIERQGDDGALVTSKLPGSNASFFLFSEDDRAVVSSFGFVNTDPYAAVFYDAPQAEGYAKTADATSNINFALGSLAPGRSTTVTFYMGVTNELATTIAQIERASDDSDDDDGRDDDDDGDDTPEVVDTAPVVTNDKLTVQENGKGSGNVLANDRDPEGAKLSAALKAGPANGVVTLSADGSFVYTSKAGFSGSDSFTYTASDGKNATVGSVSVTVEAAPEPTVPVPTTPVGDLLGRAGLVNGSSSANQVLTGAEHANTFFFDVDATTGSDAITNFAKNDVLVVDRKLYDGNNDGIINLSNGNLSIDAPKVGDSVALKDLSALRYLGTDDNGLAVYADASVRPRGAKESTVADNKLTGDSSDKKADVFFFDTALGVDLGADQIAKFGKRDMIVTTSKLEDGNNDGLISLANSTLDLGGAGSVVVKNMVNTAVNTLEFDGAVVRDGVTYYVYTRTDSVVDAGDLSF